MNSKSYYTFRFSVGDVVLKYGITKDLSKEEQKLKQSDSFVADEIGNSFFYRDGRIEQIGCITTKESAQRWLMRKSPEYFDSQE